VIAVIGPAAMQELGQRVAGHLRAGDVLVLTGNLGAGKTTFVQGLARGLGIVEPVTSPTFVISRVLPAPTGPDLVHMDAYRLGGSAELLDLDVEVEAVITVIEWGHDAGPMIADDVLELVIDIDEEDPDLRRVEVVARGGRFLTDGSWRAGWAEA
jgi:tRNA threonylcarbamoyladenosine biosynthesis protein TsaE